MRWLKANGYQEVLNRIFHVMFFVSFLFLFINVVTSKKNDSLPILILSIILLVFVFSLHKCLTIYENYIERNSKIIITSIFILMMVIQMYLGYKLRVKPSWDFGFVYDEAVSMIQSGDFSVKNLLYFLRYPNNWLYLIILVIFYQGLSMFGISDFLIPSLGLNIIMINIGLLFLYLICVKLWNKKTGVFILLLSLLFAPYYTYVPIFYTDTFPIPFTMAMIYLFIISLDKKRKWTYHIGIGILCYIGFSLKATVIIILIAIFLYALLMFSLQNAFKMICVIMISFITISMGYNIILKNSGFINMTDLDKHNFPYTHWVMMGLKNPGGYNGTDDYFTRSFPTKAEKTKANLNEIQKRLDDYGVSGFLNHLKIKNTQTWNDGTYFSSILLERKAVEKSNWIQSFILRDGKFYYFYNLYVNGFHIMILGLMLYSIFMGILNPKITLTMMFRLSVFGLMLFLLIWESKSKYLYNFLPLFFVVAYDGLVMIEKLINCLKTRKVVKTNA